MAATINITIGRKRTNSHHHASYKRPEQAKHSVLLFRNTLQCTSDNLRAASKNVEQNLLRDTQIYTLIIYGKHFGLSLSEILHSY